MREKGKRGRKIKRLENEVSEHENALKEIQDLEDSDQKYSIFTKSKNLRDGTDGRVSYDTENDIVNEEIRGTNKSDLAHELKHAHQFEEQELSFGADGIKPGDLYDQVNEQEAYDRGKAYGSGKRFSPKSYNLENRPNKRSLDMTKTSRLLLTRQNLNSKESIHIYKAYKVDMFIGRYFKAKTGK